MKKFRSIELGSTVAFYSNRGMGNAYTDQHGYSRIRKMVSIVPSSMGKVVKIHGVNGDSARVTLDTGAIVPVGLSTHYHLDNNQGDCLHHREGWSD